MRALGTKHADVISEKTFRTRKMRSVALLALLFVAWTAPLRSAPYNFEDLRDEHEDWIERAIEVGPAQAHKERAEARSRETWIHLIFWAWIIWVAVAKSAREKREAAKKRRS